jgi:hypothetical protein
MKEGRFCSFILTLAAGTWAVCTFVCSAAIWKLKRQCHKWVISKHTTHPAAQLLSKELGRNCI